jgi:hypothetical protein
MATPSSPSLMSLFTAVIDEGMRLIQTEVRLAKAEISDKIGRLANSGVALASGAIIVLAAIIMLLTGIVHWLVVAGIPDQWGYLIVGVVAGGIGVGVLAKGLSDLKAANLMPDRTIDQVKADFQAVKEHVS